MKPENCQNAYIESISKKSIRIKLEQITVRFLRKIKFYLFTRAVKNRLGLKIYYSGTPNAGKSSLNLRQYTSPASAINEGDWVRIRSKEEILHTLNEHNKLEGCFFMQEMFDYCGTEHRVLRKVDNFFDEAKSEMRKAKTTYILEDLHCHGKLTGYPTTCDRYCYSFWKDAWLEKIEAPLISQIKSLKNTALSLFGNVILYHFLDSLSLFSINLS